MTKANIAKYLMYLKRQLKGKKIPPHEKDEIRHRLNVIIKQLQ